MLLHAKQRWIAGSSPATTKSEDGGGMPAAKDGADTRRCRRKTMQTQDGADVAMPMKGDADKAAN
jgi:hypothetical protein